MNNSFIIFIPSLLLVGFLFASFISFSESISHRILHAFYYQTRKKIHQKWHYIFEVHSKCTHCGSKIPFYFLIPILGIIFTKFRCKFCKNKINKQYLYFEVLAFLYGMSIFYRVSGYEALFLAFMFIFVTMICIIDFKVMFIPTSLLILISGISVLEYIFLSEDYTLDIFIALIWYTFFYLLYILSRYKMGFADVNLIFPLSLSLSFSYAILLPSLASILGLCYFFIHKKTMNKGMKTKLPLGTFLGIAYFFLKLKPDFFNLF